MDLIQLNQYLSCLEGPANIEHIKADKHDITGNFTIKFNGDVGTLDKGEIELKFVGVEAMCMPFGLIAPVEIMQINELAENLIGSNYTELDCNLYQLSDDVDTKWWVYSKGFEVTLLPVFYV
jgi:hypothetical protein